MKKGKILPPYSSGCQKIWFFCQDTTENLSKKLNFSKYFQIYHILKNSRMFVWYTQVTDIPLGLGCHYQEGTFDQQEYDSENTQWSWLSCFLLNITSLILVIAFSLKSKFSLIDTSNWRFFHDFSHSCFFCDSYAF